jgi:hypothetical protein
VTREQVEELLQDVVVSGKVNVIALIESLQVKRDPRAPDVQEALDRLGNLFAGGKRFKDTVQMFENFDENGDGKIQHKEFMAVVKKLVAEDQKNNPGNSLEISDEMIKKIIHVIDANNSAASTTSNSSMCSTSNGPGWTGCWSRSAACSTSTRIHWAVYSTTWISMAMGY